MKKGIYIFGISMLTTFLILTIAGVVVAAKIQPTETPAPTIDPQVLAGLLERDQAARDIIQKANDQILSETATPDPTAIPAPTPTPWPISPAAAEAIVHLIAPGAVITTPAALVDFQGTVAYEIKTNLGLVYIDAATGKVLYNGTVRISDYVAPAPSGGGAGGAARSHDDEGGNSEHDD
jgi:hypothetical protein